jgi:hypothetical protein
MLRAVFHSPITDPVYLARCVFFSQRMDSDLMLTFPTETGFRFFQYSPYIAHKRTKSRFCVVPRMRIKSVPLRVEVRPARSTLVRSRKAMASLSSEVISCEVLRAALHDA